MEDRRMFALSSDDTEYLSNAFPHWETISGQWLLIHDFPICEGYTSKLVTAAIQIPTNYPAVPLDMVYFNPPLVRSDRQSIPRTECTVTIDGLPFQRWSRHYRTGEWVPNEDNIATHVLAISGWLERASAAQVTG